MSGQRPDESFEQFVVRHLWETGSFWSPANPEGHGLSMLDLKKLKLTDPVVVTALIEMSYMDTLQYTKHVLDHHGRLPHFDGVVGPAMRSMLEEGGRCPVPDFVPPPGVSFLFEDPNVQEIALRMQARQVMAATGTGGWKNCNGVVDAHCVAVRVNPSGMNPRAVPLWPQIMRNVQKKYAGVGMLVLFIGMDGKDLLTGQTFTGRINTTLTFVQRSDGWIGLAIVGQSETCSSQEIWLRLLATYLGGTTDEDIIRQLSALLAHELGHNFYLGHTPGGVMNSSIRNDLPPDVWPASDPSTPKLIKLYSGVPVQIPGGLPPVDPPTTPPSDIERQLFEMRVKNATQDAALMWSASRMSSLDARIRKLEGV